MAYAGKQNSVTLPELGFRFCIVGEELKHHETLIDSIKAFNLPVTFSDDGQQFINQGAEFTTIFILNEFEGEVFVKLRGQRILGPTIVLQCAKNEESLPNNIRPLYTASMKGMAITFTGFRVKEEVQRLATLIHSMGGSIRKDYNLSRTTHLVATPNAKYGEKYKYAVTMGIPIMTPEWIYQTWSRRHDEICRATDDDLMQYRLLPFVGCKLAFLGYENKEDMQHMTDISLKNGGEIVNSNDPECTHIVIDDRCTIDYSIHCQNAFFVKNEWFWACVQIEAKGEEGLYIHENPNNVALSSTYIKPIRGNKRKRLESVAHQLHLDSLQLDHGSLYVDLNKGASETLLEISSDKSLDLSCEEEDIHKKSAHIDLRTLSPRQQVCLELFQTERNYVGILQTIITVFKQPLEEPKVGQPLLAPAEVKIIFGKIPPIFRIHEKIKDELSEIINNWNNDHSIGNLILNHAHDLMKSYPPFVNFFEKTKNLLSHCDATKPRFHAFLKVCQSRPECGRQTLQELLIRPVQRLPSVILLLQDLLKRTPKSCKDHSALEKAIQSLKEVLMHINEDKRKTEGQVEMFDIVNDIDNCPANLLSSHRNLVTKVDTQEISDRLNKKNCTTTLFLFTDVLEICKKRTKAAANNSKSVSIISLPTASHKNDTKSYKHLELIPLSHIKRVVDVVESNECKNVFAIAIWSIKEVKELLYVFILLDEINKTQFLRSLCRQVANNACKVDSEPLLTSLEAEQLDLQDSENSGNTLSKALSKTKLKLTRALSMKKSPPKRSLSRAVSTFISPLRNFGTNNNTMSTLKLSSYTNLTELVPPARCLTPSPMNGNKPKPSSLGPSLAKFIL